MGSFQQKSSNGIKRGYKSIHQNKVLNMADTAHFNSDSDQDGGSDSDVSDRLSDTGYEAEDGDDDEKSGMASVVARILSKDISKSNRVLLAKGKTNKEILTDISKRKRQRDKTDDVQDDDSDLPIHKTSRKEILAKEEKRKIWESMGRKIPSVLDNPRETKLRKLATQGMVQLFRSVNEHQKVMREKLSSVGDSEIKRDKVMSQFSKGKFLDLLKGKNVSERKHIKNEDDGAKWKILKDDYMMGASMKDWDKDDSGGEDNYGQDEGDLDADVLSD